MLRQRFIAIQSYFKKQENHQINNPTFHLKQLEKEEMKNPRVSRRKEIIKIRVEINEKETKETIVKINKAKSWFFVFNLNSKLFSLAILSTNIKPTLCLVF